MTLLDKLPKTSDSGTLISARELRARLRELGVETSRVESEPGLRVSLAHLQLSAGTRIKAVRAALEDLTVNLAVRSVRLRTNMKPGMVTLEIAHDILQVPTVSLGDVLEPGSGDGKVLPWALGLEANGDRMVVDLADAPHVLIGGQTGSGKSSHLHALVTSLALMTDPATVELIFVDPKQVDLVMFRDLPHVVREPVTTLAGAQALVRDLKDEVDFRYEEFARAGVTDIASYNAWASQEPDEEPLPRMVLIIDELSMLIAGKEGEQLSADLTTLAQVCRASGLHLVFATQRPSATSMPTQLRSQLTTRIACRVATVADSRMVLDAPGAEKLLGAGDTLVRWGGAEPFRVQGTFVHKVWCEYITNEVYLDYFHEMEEVETPETESVRVDMGDLTAIHAESNLLEGSPLKMSTGPKLTGALFTGGLLIGSIVSWLIWR